MLGFNNKLSLLILSFYLIGRFLILDHVIKLNTYHVYFWEFAICLVFIMIHKKHFLRLLDFPTIDKKIGLFVLGIGVITAVLAHAFDILVPINRSDIINISLLLLLAPILEEVIFRFLIWVSLTAVLNQKVVLHISSFLFAYSHLHSIWFVDSYYQSFILYQALYTLGLGYILGWCIYRYNSLVYAIAMHFLFNLGFYFGLLLHK